MTGLSAEELNAAFFRSFMPETIFVIPGEEEAAAIAMQEDSEVTASVPAEEVETPPATITPLHKPAPLPKIPKVEPVIPASFVVKGENKKGVIILATLPPAAFENLPELEFLQKILAAIGLQKDDVAYANNVSGAFAQFEELSTQVQVKYVISFASRINTDIPHEKFTLYNPVVVGNVPIVFSQSLEVLDKDQEQKKQLWAALKQVFL